jgi:hypothetical protein
MVLGNLLGGFIVILIGVNLIPTIADQIFIATDNGTGGPTNITGASVTVLNLTTIFFALGIMAAGVALAVNGLKNAGVL